jgi:ribosome-interacting GTPase 1
MSDLVVELVAVGRELDHIDITLNPDRARALLRRRKELEHKIQENRQSSELTQAQARKLLRARREINAQLEAKRGPVAAQ